MAFLQASGRCGDRRRRLAGPWDGAGFAHDEAAEELSKIYGTADH